MLPVRLLPRVMRAGEQAAKAFLEHKELYAKPSQTANNLLLYSKRANDIISGKTEGNWHTFTQQETKQVFQCWEKQLKRISSP